MESLIRLFGSAAKVKLIKLFIFNPNSPFDLIQLAARTKEVDTRLRRELGNLEKIDLVKRRVFYKTIERGRGSRATAKKVKTSGWVLNDNFPYLIPLHTFLVSVNHLTPKELSRKLSNAGNIKLIIAAGTFIHDPESRVDLLVVGDNIKKGSLEHAIQNIEAEMGKEIRYAVFETSDFKYRLGLYDKLVRDILDFPHEKIVNKLGI